MERTKQILLTSFCTLLACVFTSCEVTPESETYESGNYKNFQTMLNHCKGTTRIIGVGEMDGSLDHCKINIVVIDSTNTSYGCRIGGTLGMSVGDTVKRVPNAR